MLSKFIVEFLQRLLGEKYPAFAYWLFYSEMNISLIFGLHFPPFLIYAAFNFIAARNYGRKRALAQGKDWTPSRFDKVVAFFLQTGMAVVGFGGAGLSFIGGAAWWTTALLAIIGILALGWAVGLLRGNWPEWP